MNTPTYVMAVPFDLNRVRNAKHLHEQEGAVVVWDQRRSIVDTFLRVLEAAGEGPAIILQDDVQLTTNWRQKVEAVIAEHPDVVCQFFSLRKSDLKLGARMVRGGEYLSNLCFYLPKGYPAELRSYAEQWFAERPGHTGDDSCIGEWLKSRKERYWHHVPSLVQHHQWSSAVNTSRSSKRISPTFEE